MTRAETVNEARRLVWRNITPVASTFSQCDCGRAAGRGGGPCVLCAEDMMARVTGREFAEHYVKLVREFREMEGKTEEEHEALR